MNFCRLLCTCLCLLSFLCLAPPRALAGEKEHLLQLAGELDFMLQSVSRAEAAAPAGGDVLFDYAALRADLRRVRRAILDHASEPSRRPRQLAPLRARYGR